jgi:small ligand-binding sensory domain FIST
MMTATTFKAVCATGADWQTILGRCLEDLGTGPADANFGLLYVTAPLAAYLDEVLAAFRNSTGIAHWTGSAGAGICFSGREIYDEPAMAVMLASFPEDSFRLIPAGIKPLSEMLISNLAWISEHQANFAIVHADPRNPHIPQIIESLSNDLDSGFLVGGLSSAEEPCGDGLSGVLFSSEVQVISGLTQGCIPLGPKHTVSECDRNILAKLDGRPALDVFCEDIGEVLSKDLSRVAGYIFAGLPVPGSDTGDYLVRNLIGIDPGQKLLAVGDLLEEQTTIMFCKRDGESARQDMLRMLDDLGKRARGGIKGGVYYSCLGRGRHQFGVNSEELKMIRDELGDFPLVGFFANGEISHNRLYGYTGVLTLFV